MDPLRIREAWALIRLYIKQQNLKDSTSPMFSGDDP